MTQRSRRSKVRIAAIAGAGLVAASVVGATQIAGAAEQSAAKAPAAITLPTNIRQAIADVSPPNSKPIGAYLAAKGPDVQKYTCGADGLFPTASVPEAGLTRLLAESGLPNSIHHFGGPRWESSDGSIVLGAVAKRVEVPGQLPWLQISVTHEGSAGALDKVTGISRVLTDGGTAPAGACTPGTVQQVPYAAVYVLWGAK